jgi:hypothetical protein
MPDRSSSEFGRGDDRWGLSEEVGPSGEGDLVMEQILESIQHTPLGQVLNTIASLPGVRREKVLDLRRKITEGRYELSERLDRALDKVLEDLIS